MVIAVVVRRLASGGRLIVSVSTFALGGRAGRDGLPCILGEVVPAVVHGVGGCGDATMVIRLGGDDEVFS